MQKNVHYTVTLKGHNRHEKGLVCSGRHRQMTGFIGDGVDPKLEVWMKVKDG